MKQMKENKKKENSSPQKIMVFQQNGSGETKLKGIREHGKAQFDIEIVAIDGPLPPIIDDAEEYLPSDIRADMVLDFLKHPDISHDLAEICHQKNIPVVASGKKLRVKSAFTPPI